MQSGTVRRYTREGPMQSVGVDVGGTFTDIAAVRAA